MRLDRGDDVPGDFILQVEDVAQVTVVPLGPYVLAGRRVNELAGHADPAAVGPHAAFEDVTDRQLQRDLPNVDGSPLVGESRVACDHEEPAQAGQRRRNILGDPVREILLLGITAHVRERQDRD
jgi:hypothetical protein